MFGGVQTSDLAQAMAPQNKAQTGPKSSLIDECAKHAGFKVIFRSDANDDSTEGDLDKANDYCEKCFAEISSKKNNAEARNAAQERISAQANDDLLTRLKEPAQPL